MNSIDTWQATFDSWAGQDPFLASTGEPSNPDEFASVGLVLEEWLALSGTERVLDVGCASGTLTSTWAAGASEVVGVDFSAGLLRDASLRFSGSNMSFAQADAAKLPFADDSFDRVVCCGVLLCLPDHRHVRRAIDEILRVTRPGGRIVLSSLPDARLRGVFFDHCEAHASWYHRTIPRHLRWRAKRLLKPGSTPGETMILWFDIQDLAQELEHRGYRVSVEVDPEFSNYADYRKSLLITGEEVGA